MPSLLNEANSILGHERIKELLSKRIAINNPRIATELHLPNNKIADIIYLGGYDAIHIVEVKAEFRPYYLNNTFTKYADYCHYLWLAIPAGLARAEMDARRMITWPEAHDAVGIIEVDWRDASIIRSAVLRTILDVRAVAARSALATRLTAGEPAPGLKTAPRR